MNSALTCSLVNNYLFFSSRFFPVAWWTRLIYRGKVNAMRSDDVVRQTIPARKIEYLQSPLVSPHHVESCTDQDVVIVVVTREREE